MADSKERTGNRKTTDGQALWQTAKREQVTERPQMDRHYGKQQRENRLQADNRWTGTMADSKERIGDRKTTDGQALWQTAKRE